jgi:hypothetical protein
MEELAEHDETRWLGEAMGPDHGKQFEQFQTYTYRAEGQVIACAGMILFWADRGEVWAALAEGIEKHFVGLHRAMRRQMDAVPVARLEAKVDKSYVNAHTWVRLLGFKIESPTLEKYFPDGRDATGYVRIK